MNPLYDVIVIGAGPAGSSAAIMLAQQGLKILLLEKSHFPRQKLCGEFLSPETLPIFARLNVQKTLFEAGAQIINQWTLFAPDGRGVEIPMRWIAGIDGHGIGISRAMMDSILLNRTREVGVDVHEGVQVTSHLTRSQTTTIVEAKTDGDTREVFSGRLIINASGRGRLFANKQHQPSRLNDARIFGCKVHLRGVADLEERGELFFFKDGYGGMSHVEGGRTNLCFLTTEKTLLAVKGNRQRLLETTLLANPAAEKRLRHASIDGEWLGTGPLFYGRQPQTAGILDIGDAGAFIDPFTGSGMLLAMHSAELAAQAVQEIINVYGSLDAPQVIQLYHSRHRAEFGWRLRVAAALRALAFKPMARNMLATLLTRNQSFARFLAQSTRSQGLFRAALTNTAD